MITNTGKKILGKYLIGQSPGYASHIAIGCGPTPLEPSGLGFGDYSIKTNLDFEMARVPIVSRGYVDEDGITKLSLTAELPTSERYEITEVGVFSGGSNPAANGNDSRTLLAFNDQENWQYGDNDTLTLSSIPKLTYPLDQLQVGITNITSDGSTITYETDYSTLNDNVFLNGTFISISGVTPSVYNLSNVQITGSGVSGSVYTFSVSSTIITPYITGGIAVIALNDGYFRDSINYPALRTNSDNTIFFNQTRSNRYERSRMLSDTLLVAFNPTGSQSKYVQLSGISFDLDKYSPNDEIRLAFVVSDIGRAGTSSISEISIKLEFLSQPTVAPDINDPSIVPYGVKTLTLVEDFYNNRYFIARFKLSEIQSYNGFAWKNISLIKITPQISETSIPLNMGYVYLMLDSMRIENVTTISPLYGLTGYSVIKNTNAQPIIKNANSNNLIEFRFSVDTDGGIA